MTTTSEHAKMLGKHRQRKFDDATVRAWRDRILAGETYEAVADASGLDVSGCNVYYHVNKLGSLAGVPRASRAKAREVCAPPRVPVRREAPVALASELAAPSEAARMAGRARIPRRIERLEGVEA